MQPRSQSRSRGGCLPLRSLVQAFLRRWFYLPDALERLFDHKAYLRQRPVRWPSRPIARRTPAVVALEEREAPQLAMMLLFAAEAVGAAAVERARGPMQS